MKTNRLIEHREWCSGVIDGVKSHLDAILADYDEHRSDARFEGRGNRLTYAVSTLRGYLSKNWRERPEILLVNFIEHVDGFIRDGHPAEDPRYAHKSHYPEAVRWEGWDMVLDSVASFLESEVNVDERDDTTPVSLDQSRRAS